MLFGHAWSWKWFRVIVKNGVSSLRLSLQM